MTIPHRRLAGVLVLLAAVAPWTLGCSTKPKKASVSGKVTISGKALNQGTVSFISPKDATSASIGSDGSYSMKDAPVGDVVITVTVPKYLPPAKVPPGIGPMKPPGGPEEPVGKSTAPVLIPDRYARQDTSGLTYTVQSGSQVHDIDLKP